MSEFAKVLRRGVRSLGPKKIRKLENRFGSIEKLENVDEEEVLAIDGIGPRTTERIGIWNDAGNPVGTINRKPCPNCDSAYDESIRLGEYQIHEKIDVEKYDEICIEVTGGRFRSDPFITQVYLHK